MLQQSTLFQVDVS